MTVISTQAATNNLDYHKDAFNSVGWFIPPYVTFGFISELAKEITVANGTYSQDALEVMLSRVYSPEHLASMVLDRYSVTPFIKEYSQIISEAVLAHFSSLDHIAVAGLMPVIEGAGKALAKEFSVQYTSIREVFINLADCCKALSAEKNIGAVGEVASMLDSFKEYTDKNLYIGSGRYPHADKTNRHGILHGAYKDEDYGRPINFYKAIAAVNFLCFISAFRAPISWFAPNPTDESEKLARYYRFCALMAKTNPTQK